MTLETVEQIVALLVEHPVSEIALERDGRRLRVCKPLVNAPAPPPPPADPEPPPPEASAGDAPAAEADDVGPVLLTSTMVGLFHHATPLVGYGALVAPGQVIGSIESMKVMNDVPAEGGGRVVDVFVEEGAPVEYGQPLFRLGPA